MKKLLIILCLFSANLKAQTMTVNGISVNQNDTVKCGNIAHVECLNIPNYVTYMERVYWGVTYPFSGAGDFLTSKNPKLLRLNFYSNGVRCYTFRVYILK